MKVGIITHWNVPNYGTFFQAYSLRNTISVLFPEAQVELVDYIKPIHIRMYYSFEVHELFHLWIINPRFYLDIIHRLHNYKVIKGRRYFKEYYDNYIAHSNKNSEMSIEKEDYDVIVLGSDILWDYSVGFFGKDPVMFGLNTTRNNKISYAASFGRVKRNYEHPQYVIDGVKQLNHISVRDENSALIVEDITGKKPEVVLDPVFLWDFRCDDNISEPCNTENYMVVYGTDFSETQIMDAKRYSKDNGLRIISIEGDKGCNSWADDECEIKEMTPFQWAGYLKNSDVVMTCTYHGLIFSLIYNKKLFFNATSFMRVKAESMLNRYGLQSVLLRNKSFTEQVNSDWDKIYNSFNIAIQEDRYESIGYLNRALSTC